MPIHLFANQPTQLALNPSPKLQPSDDVRETRRRRRRRCWSVVSVSQSVSQSGMEAGRERKQEFNLSRPRWIGKHWRCFAAIGEHVLAWWAGGLVVERPAKTMEPITAEPLPPSSMFSRLTCSGSLGMVLGSSENIGSSGKLSNPSVHLVG